VKSAPNLQSARIDRLYNGNRAYIYGDWLGVVYGRIRERTRCCGVSVPWPRTAPYTGPRASGWVDRRWITTMTG
jgi:hypothetical protein